MPGRIRQILAILPALLWGACAAAPAPAPVQIQPAEVRAQADSHLAFGNYDEAGRLYSWLVEAFPHGPETPRAQFGLARIDLARGDFAAAAASFSQFRLNYPNHPLSGKALLYQSECAERIDSAAKQKRETELAKRALQKAPPPPSRSAGREPLLAVQVLWWDPRDARALDAEMARLKAAGFNAVLFRVFSNPGDRLFPLAAASAAGAPARVGVYFKTTHAPVVADLLGIVAKAARRNGLAVYAWMTSRYADYGLAAEQKDRWSERTYDLETGAILPGRGLDLFNERVLEHLERLYGDLASYPVDGILFQDDLVSRHTDGFSSAAAAAYQKHFGEPLDPLRFYRDVYRPEGAPKAYVGQYTDAFWRWVAWKNARLLDVAERLAAVVKKKRPRAKVAVNFMYEAASSPQNALAWLSQSLSSAHPRPFDYYAVMAYHRQMREELGLSFEETLTLIRRMSRSLYAGAHPDRALMKLQIRDWSTSEPVGRDELAAVAAAVREGAGGTGVVPNLAVVPYAGAADLARIPESFTGRPPRRGTARK